MELKTKVNAEEGKQDLVITREFDLPVELLFKAHAEPAILEQWMSNPFATAKVLKFEGKKHGSYQQEATDANGKVVFQSNGVFHEFITNKKIIRTFEMENAPFGVQFEIYEFEKISENTSKLNMHVIYESVALRDQLLKMPFAQGLNMAHDRIQEMANKLK
ncbi:MAG TPA: SRPBCC domain-containing protein [Bacteroidia bacterium]|nr:SRPBCC domain-containing protein [Bacteroidia bacterium]